MAPSERRRVKCSPATDMMTPMGALQAAFCVSSDMCADASNPVLLEFVSFGVKPACEGRSSHRVLTREDRNHADVRRTGPVSPPGTVVE